MRTVDFRELGVRLTIEGLPIGATAALADAGVEEAIGAAETAVVLLEAVTRVEPKAAAWVVPVLSHLRRGRAALSAGLTELRAEAPPVPDTFPWPKEGAA